MSSKKSTPAPTKAKIIDPGTPEVPVLNTGKEQGLYDDQMGLLDQVYGGISKITGDLNNGRESFIKNLYEPQEKEITKQYDKAFGNAASSAGNLGMLKSLGFADYATNELQKGKVEALNNARSQAELNAYNLPNTLLSPYLSLGQFADTGLASLQDRINANWNNEFMRAQMLNNANLGQASQLNAYNLNQPQKSKFLGIF